jgi:hypothetical protein
VAPIDKQSLHGRWVHSHEEDSGGEMVFRRPDHEFPRARGRRSFELRPDGTYADRSPGPVDVPVESTGSWSLDGDRLTVGDEAWRVKGVEPGRLTVRR